MTAALPLSYMEGAGSRSARTLEQIAWGFTGISVAVIVVIALLIGLAMARARTPAGAGGDQGSVTREGNGLRLIWWGVGLSLPVLVAMALWNFLATRALATVPPGNGPSIEVTGHRWWWEVRYDDTTAGAVTSANEIVIPVGVPVRLRLASGDVIHDFWVPKLGPKMDMIPGRTNQTWLEADRPGDYRGQCAEYCGLEHARMSLVVHAVAPADYAAWLARQRAPVAIGAEPAGPATPAPATPPQPGSAGALAPVSATPAPPAPQDLFVDRCGACHTARGTGAGGILGPDLTHFGARSTLAAGMLANTPDNLSRWIADPQAVKPGVLMPVVKLTPVERTQLVNWLEGLR